MALVPFTNEYELQRVVQRCHNVLWERHGFDPAQAFDEFSKLLYVKLYDEMASGGRYAHPGFMETTEGFASRVRTLFREANESSIAGPIFPGQEILADALSIHQVLLLLQNYSLLQTTSQVGGADVKGTIYESIIGNTFRGELGQFFTPRTVVEFMVRLMSISRTQVVYDPSCGSGGFLIMCAKLVRERLQQNEPAPTASQIQQELNDYSRRCLIGTEINERTARVARLNLLMHGLSYENIFTANALKTADLNDPRLDSLLRPGTVDVIFANPPFAGFEKDQAVLSQYELGQNGHGSAAAVTREVLFLERIVKLLRVGGVAGIVLPQGILTNRNLARVRSYIRQYCEILAVIELPDWAFIPSGTNVRGSLLFMRRLIHVPQDYPVFMKRVENIGYTSAGRATPNNDLPATIEEFRKRDARYLVPISDVQDRIDAKFYLPEHRAAGALFRENASHRLARLSDIGSFDVDCTNPRLTPDREVALIETSSVDPGTLSIKPKYVRGRDCSYGTLRRVQAGDILISRRRAYRGAIVIVPAGLDGALAIHEFSVFRLRPGYDKDYVVEILRSPEFVQLMTIYSTGEMSGRVNERDLARMQIPLPDDHFRLGSLFREKRQRIMELRRLASEEEGQIAQCCSAVIVGAQTLAAGGDGSSR